MHGLQTTILFLVTSSSAISYIRDFYQLFFNVNIILNRLN